MNMSSQQLQVTVVGATAPRFDTEAGRRLSVSTVGDEALSLQDADADCLVVD